VQQPAYPADSGPAFTLTGGRSALEAAAASLIGHRVEAAVAALEA
jgi:hypothetical protein